uniref:Protein Spindly n=1 Tax=Glossina brevipalpis TaxID=37001 RepID=A0A1A9WKR2_9MUSC
MEDYPNVVNLSRDDLLEKYVELNDRYKEMVEVNSNTSEASAQRIHELKRALDTATAAEAYLAQELEQLTSCESNRIASGLQQLQEEIEKLKNVNGTLKEDYNSVLEENIRLTKVLEETVRYKTDSVLPPESKISDEHCERMQILEDENNELLRKVEEFQERFVRYTMTIAEHEKNNEVLRDQVNCLESNLHSKRTDLEEMESILESTQEQLIAANANLALLSTKPENDDRKGNSLFAEVDDQRQAMKQLLNAQKKSYLEMRKIYNESEHEIRRLKRENTAMRTELEACTSIFCYADKTYQEKLNQRIQRLLSENEDLERKVNWTQERLKELSSEKGVLWLDSMLTFCNWRFESLKSRCVLLNREYLLNEHKITFNPVETMDFHITQKEQEEARPRIVDKRGNDQLNTITTPETKNQELPSEFNELNLVENVINPSPKSECSSSSEENSKNELKCNEFITTSERKNEELVKEFNELNLVENVINPSPKSECPSSSEENSKNESECNEFITTSERKNEELVEEFNELKVVENVSNPSSKSECSSSSEEKSKNESEFNEFITRKDCEFKAVSPAQSFTLYKDNENQHSSPKIRGQYLKVMKKSPATSASQKDLEKLDREDKCMKKSHSILTQKRNLFCKDTKKNVTFSTENTIHSPTFDRTSSQDHSCVANISNTKAAIKETRLKSSIVVRRVIVNSRRD